MHTSARKDQKASSVSPASTTVVVIQEVPIPGSVERNAQRVIEALRSFPDGELFVFPEMFLGGYDLDRVRDVAIDVNHDEAIAAIGAAAAERGSSVILGLAESRPAAIFNSAACIDQSGTLVGCVQKTHMFGAEGTVFTPGSNLRIVEMGALRVAVMVCFDMEFPEVGLTLAAQEPDLFVVCSANMHPYEQDHRIAAQARALENRLPLVYCNRIGQEAGVTFVGQSRVVSSGGEILDELGSSAGTLTIDVAIRELREPDVDYQAHRRPDLYRTQ